MRSLQICQQIWFTWTPYSEKSGFTYIGSVIPLYSEKSGFTYIGSVIPLFWFRSFRPGLDEITDSYSILFSELSLGKAWCKQLSSLFRRNNLRLWYSLMLCWTNYLYLPIEITTYAYGGSTEIVIVSCLGVYYWPCAICRLNEQTCIRI
jgi:hypothetical protein